MFRSTSRPLTPSVLSLPQPPGPEARRFDAAEHPQPRHHVGGETNGEDDSDLDAGSPADGIKIIEAKVGAVYKATTDGDRFKSIRYPEVGHTYTPEMRKEMLAWFDKWLK